MSREVLHSMAVSLALTLALESVFFLGVRSFMRKFDKKDLLLALLVNILTNPAIVFIYLLTVLYTGINGVIMFLILEAFAVLTEGYMYKSYGRHFKHPYIFSLTANLFSFGTGYLLQVI